MGGLLGIMKTTKTKRLEIVVILNNDKTLEKVKRIGFEDSISGSFEYIGILEGLKQQEMDKLKNWINIERDNGKSGELKG